MAQATAPLLDSTQNLRSLGAKDRLAQPVMQETQPRAAGIITAAGPKMHVPPGGDHNPR